MSGTFVVDAQEAKRNANGNVVHHWNSTMEKKYNDIILNLNQRNEILQSERDVLQERFNYQEAEGKDLRQRVWKLEQELKDFDLKLKQNEINYELHLKKVAIESELSSKENMRKLQNTIDTLKTEALEKERLFKVERESLITQAQEFSNRIRDKYNEMQEELRSANLKLSTYKEADTKIALHQKEILALSKENEDLLNELRQCKKRKLVNEVSEEMEKELMIVKQQNTELQTQVKLLHFFETLVPALKRELSDYSEKEKYFKTVQKEFLIFKDRDQNVLLMQEKINQLEKSLKAAEYKNVKLNEIENNYKDLLKQKETIERNFGALKEFDSPFHVRKFISDLQQQNIKLITENGSFKQDLVEVKEKFRRESEEANNLKAQKKQLHKRLSDQEKEMKLLKVLNASLLAENGSFKNILKTYELEGEIMNATTYDKLKSQHIKTLEDKAKDLENSIKILQQENEEITKRTLSSEKELTIHINKLREKIENSVNEFGPSQKSLPGVPSPRLYQIKIVLEGNETNEQTNVEAEKLPEETNELLIKLQNLEKSHSKLLNVSKKKYQLLKLMISLLFGYTIESCDELDEKYLLFPTLPHPSKEQYLLFSHLRSESALTLDHSPYLDLWKKEADYFINQKESLPAFLANMTMKLKNLEILKEINT